MTVGEFVPHFSQDSNLARAPKGGRRKGKARRWADYYYYTTRKPRTTLVPPPSRTDVESTKTRGGGEAVVVPHKPDKGQVTFSDPKDSGVKNRRRDRGRDQSPNGSNCKKCKKSKSKTGGAILSKAVRMNSPKILLRGIVVTADNEDEEEDEEEVEDSQMPDLQIVEEGDILRRTEEKRKTWERTKVL